MQNCGITLSDGMLNQLIIHPHPVLEFTWSDYWGRGRNWGSNYHLWLCLIIGECDRTKISERIKETQSKYVYVFPGNQAIINWTWCSAVNSTITGIVIYRVSRVNSRILLNHLLSMDLSKTVHYLKDNSRHELCSVENKTSFEEKTVFIINNVTKADSGAYSLHIRREGDSDLQSEVKVVIKIIGRPEFSKHVPSVLPEWYGR